MALSGAQKNKILQLLGYPGRAIDPSSVSYIKALSDRLENLPDDTEGLVVEMLENVATVETQMAAAPGRFISSQVDDIKLNENEIEKLRKERRLLARELGSLLDIPPSSGGGIGQVV